MANNQGNDYQDKFKGNFTGAMKKAFSTGAKFSYKVTSKGASLGIKTILKVIRKIVTAVASSAAAFLVVILVIFSMLSGLIIGTAIKMTSDTNMEQEAPELTKAYLNTYEDEFKNKIYELIQDERFNSYVLNGEFDNAYTKLVYGGTNAYSQKELKGYAKADNEDASWVNFSKDGKEVNNKIDGLNKLITDINNHSNKEMKKTLKTEIDKDENKYNLDSSILEDVYDAYDSKSKKKKNKALNVAEDELKDANKELKELCEDGKYAKATSLLEKLQSYKTKYGLTDDKININDDYLRGYGKASGYSVDDKGNATDTGESMPFNKWINNSYYVIPYYFHVNMARNSEYKNRLGGTLTDSMNFYSNLTAIFGAEIVEDVGKLCLGASIAKGAVSDMNYKTYKKMCDSFLKQCKDKKNRKNIAIQLVKHYKKQEDIKTKSVAKTSVNIYAKGLEMKVNSISSLLKNLSANPNLQIGVPNWNVDSGDWQFMTLETKDVNKYPFLNKVWRKYKTKDSNHFTIWNNQLFLQEYIEKGWGWNGIFGQFGGNVVDSWFGKNQLFDATNLYKSKYAKLNPENFQRMSYKDILNTGFTSLKTKSPLAGKVSSNTLPTNPVEFIAGDVHSSRKKPSKAIYPAKGVLLGYKQEVVDNSTESMLNEMFGFDGLYNYYGFSSLADTDLYYWDSLTRSRSFDKSGVDKTTSDYKNFVDNLYIHKWEDTNNNYKNYLSKVGDIKTVSKRENKKKKSINNKLLIKLRDQFAAYFINQIYYTYSDNIHDSKENGTSTGGGSDYIRDFFLSDTATKEQKIAFLQRSFHAMASGSSFTYTAKEKYTIKNGKIVSELNGSTVGNLNLESKVKVNGLKVIKTPSSKITKTKTENRAAIDRGGTTYYYTKDKIKNSWPYTWDEYHSGYTDSWRQTDDGYLDIQCPFKVGNPSTKEAVRRLKEFIISKNKPFKKYALSRYDFTLNYDIDILSKKQGTSKWNKTKANLEFTFKGDGKTDLVTPKYKITVKNADKQFEKLLKNNVEWDPDFYESHKEDIDNNNYNIKTNINKEYSASIMHINSITQKDISISTIEKIINGEMGGSYPLQATMEGERDIVMDYNTAGFLTYEIQEDKDEKGNVTNVTAGVYIKFPTADMETRLAYMWEKEGMLENSLKLLEIYDKQKNLKNAEDKVDLNELIINYDATLSGADIDDTKNTSLPEMISNEMIETAFKIQKENGVPVSSTFGQIITESRGKYGKGLSYLAYKYHNLVGMKAPSKGVDPKTHKKYSNGKVNMGTKEESKNGTKYSTKAWFATYPSEEACILDRGDLLTNLKRPYAVKTRPYLNKNVQKYTVKMARKFVWAVGEVGYATASDYYTLVTGVMDEYNLYQYDNMTIEDYKTQFSGDGDVEGGGETIESVLQAAYAQAGKKYQSPPASRYPDRNKKNGIPDTFDCSSLVQFAFKYACHIDVGQSTHDQPGKLRTYKKQSKKRSFWVEEISTRNFSVSKLQRGDLVYLKGHVEFYVGNNRQFDASMHYNSFAWKKNKNGKKYKYWTKDIQERRFSVSQGLVAIFRFHFNDGNSGLAQKILKAAYTVPSPGSGLCAKWVRQVYQKAKVKIYPQAGAIQYWTNRSKMKGYVGSTNMHSIPVGALVIGHGSGSAGKKYGHVGIYMGNNMVISNVGSIKTETMSSFNNWQKANCSSKCKYHSKQQGLIGWIAPKELVNVRAGINIPKTLERGARQTGLTNADYTHYDTQSWVEPCRKVFNAWIRKGRKESRRNATIDGYYLVATKPMFGAVGDRINIILEDNTIIKAIQADTKGNEHPKGYPVSKWGHWKSATTISVVEFEYLKGKYGKGRGIDLKGWANKKVKRIENLGRYIK